MSNWDDGKHKKVHKVKITYSHDYVNSIQVYYLDDEGNTIRGVRHGDSLGTHAKEFTLDPDECITKLHYYRDDNYVTALSFSSSKRSSEWYGERRVGRTFDIESSSQGNIIGFRGRSDNDKLHDIEPYIGPIGGGERLRPTSECNWDDGEHDNVKKIHITYGGSINSIQVDYDDGYQTYEGEWHGIVGKHYNEFELYADEYLAQFTTHYAEGGHLCALSFKSNQRSLEPYGKVPQNIGGEVLTRVKILPEGYKIVGFRGICRSFELFDVDAYDRPIEFSGGPNRSGAEKFDAQGGEATKEWDDGANHDGVRNIMVGLGQKGIHYIKFDYDKNGLLNDAPIHGVLDKTFSPPQFIIDHPNEYLVSVLGYHNDDTVQGLQFITNMRESEIFGYGKGTEFKLEVTNKKIVGFHGYADTTLNSLGAYFVHFSSLSSSSSNKLKVQGGKGGKKWDDKANHDGIRKIVVGVGRKGVHYIKFDYDNNGQLEDGPIRWWTKQTFSPPPTFEIDHPREYLISVVGYYDGDIIQGLQFTTNQRESKVFGYDIGTKFTLEAEDKKIVGFYGYAAMYLNSLGAYFAPLTTP